MSKTKNHRGMEYPPLFTRRSWQSFPNSIHFLPVAVQRAKYAHPHIGVLRRLAVPTRKQRRKRLSSPATYSKPIANPIIVSPPSLKWISKSAYNSKLTRLWVFLGIDQRKSAIYSLRT